jgi:hypothetical protein
VDLENLEGLKKLYALQYKKCGQLKCAQTSARIATEHGFKKLREIRDQIKDLREKMK